MKKVDIGEQDKLQSVLYQRQEQYFTILHGYMK